MTNVLREKVTNTTLKAETDVSKNANLFVIAQTEGIKYFNLFYMYLLMFVFFTLKKKFILYNN